jgi:hypothetical protein
MTHCIFFKLHYDNELSNTETLSYIACLGKMNGVQNSRFQVTKILKINILKPSTKICNTDDSLKFGLDTYVRLHLCSNHCGKMLCCIFHTSLHDNKLPNTETVSYVMHILCAYVFDRNFEVLILWNSGRDCSVTTAIVSSSN